MRIAAGVLSLLTGCALVFQSHAPSDYNAQPTRIPPDCTTSNGWAVLDGVFVVLNVVGVAAIASDDTNPDRGTAVAGGILWALVHLASAGTGTSWASDCKKARADFENGGEDESAQSAASEAKTYERRHRAEIQQQNIPAPIAEPRGYFCSASPSNAAVGFCVRLKTECERARDVTIASLPDLAACTLVEKAWCTEDLCFPSEEACDARREMTGIELACVERE